MLIAAIQMASGPQVHANLIEAGRLIAAAAARGAKLVVLPENFALMPLNDADRRAIVEPEGAGPIQDFLAEQARRHALWLVGGTVPLTAPVSGRMRAASLLLNDRGEAVARYDKMHLFDVALPNGEQYLESKIFEAGDRVVVAETPFGRLGLAVCYDLRFPELFRAMLDQGAEIFSLPAAFTALTGEAHWEPLLRARAIENLSYVVAAAQGGLHANGRETHGDSLIASPWGEVLDRLPRGAGIVLAELDRGRLRQVRSSLPSIHHRRL